MVLQNIIQFGRYKNKKLRFYDRYILKSGAESKIHGRLCKCTGRIRQVGFGNWRGCFGEVGVRISLHFEY